MFDKLIKAIDRHADALNVRSQLDRIESKLDRIFTQGEKIMAKFTEISELIDAINVNSNETAAEVARIRTVLEGIQAQLAGGLSASEADALKARLADAITQTQTVETELKALGADPNNPVPA